MALEHGVKIRRDYHKRKNVKYMSCQVQTEAVIDNRFVKIHS